jgi:hypothetical protein
MPKKVDLTGMRFGRLLVESKNSPSPSGWLWSCRCDCGASCLVKTGFLTNGNTRSCGCLKREVVAAKNFRHGLDSRASKSPELYAYRNAKRRCNNPSDRSYSRYGGRGIEFRFASFEEFLAELGPRPSRNHSVDRKDNNGHYEAGNVRWATSSVQTANSRVGRSSATGRFLSAK